MCFKKKIKLDESKWNLFMWFMNWHKSNHPRMEKVSQFQGRFPVERSNSRNWSLNMNLNIGFTTRSYSNSYSTSACSPPSFTVPWEGKKKSRSFTREWKTWSVVQHAGRRLRTSHRYPEVIKSTHPRYGTIVSVQNLLAQDTTNNVDDEDVY